MNDLTTTHLRGNTDKPRKVDVPQACTRCGGVGGWRGWPGFTCFKCAGVGRNPVDAKAWQFPTEWTDAQIDEFLAKKEAQRQARADKKVAAQQAKGQANTDRFAAAYPELWAAMDAAEGGFLFSLADQVTRKGELSDNQIEAAERVVEQDAKFTAEREAAADAPTGKVEVEGEVVSTKWTEGQFPAYKMMVKADTGYRVWVTVPQAIDPGKGDRVRFTATLERSNDDGTFAFGKRPAKAQIVARVEEQAA
jgi:hypothetical protein